METNESSLYFELSQTYNIVKNIADQTNQIKYRTLVISDGFAKSTNAEEGFAITVGLVERFLQCNNVNLLLTAYDVKLLSNSILNKSINCQIMKSEIQNGRVVHKFKAEGIHPSKFQVDMLEDFQSLNMPAQFKAELYEVLPLLPIEKPVINLNEDLEEKYLDTIQEFLLTYSKIVAKRLPPEGKTEELLSIKKIYFKDLVK